MTETTPTRIAGRTLAEWQEFARRDDCLERMVPSDLRQLVGAALSPPADLSIDIVEAVEAEREGLDDIIARADAIYDRCKLWPEKSFDGRIGLLEMRNLWNDELRAILTAIRARPSISKVAL